MPRACTNDHLVEYAYGCLGCIDFNYLERHRVMFVDWLVVLFFWEGLAKFVSEDSCWICSLSTGGWRCPLLSKRHATWCYNSGRDKANSGGRC